VGEWLHFVATTAVSALVSVKAAEGLQAVVADGWHEWFIQYPLTISLHPFDNQSLTALS